MPNEELEIIAEKVMKNGRISPNDKFGIDPITIIMIIAIIVNVIRVIQECNKDKKDSFGSKEEYCAFFRNNIAEICRRRSFMNIMRLKKIMRKNLSKEVYYKYKDQIINGLIQTGAELSENETYTLLEHSND